MALSSLGFLLPVTVSAFFSAFPSAMACCGGRAKRKLERSCPFPYHGCCKITSQSSNHHIPSPNRSPFSSAFRSLFASSIELKHIAVPDFFFPPHLCAFSGLLRNQCLPTMISSSGDYDTAFTRFGGCTSCCFFAVLFVCNGCCSCSSSS